MWSKNEIKFLMPLVVGLILGARKRAGLAFSGFNYKQNPAIQRGSSICF
jgi:hypothetical protein